MAMNVFLSHSTRDKDFVTGLAAALAAALFEPWLCEVDVSPNENFVGSIESAPVYLPDYRPKGFVGRTTYLAGLRDMLTAEPATVLLSGEPGVGKSLLALQFAWDAQKDFDAVVYQSCGQRQVDAIGAELCDRLPIDAQSLSAEARRKKALEWLRGRQSLLVLDDVWGYDVKLLDPGRPCSVLYTSRQSTLP